MSGSNLPEGGSWLVNDVAPADVFTPEDFSDDQRAFAAEIDKFVAREIAPNLRQLESHDHAFLLELMRKCGENGFLGIEIPEEYGGLGQGLVTASLVFEHLAFSGSASFAATYGAHTGIGTVPTLLYGNDAQKARYLPKLATGDIIGAYALTETESGSDALAAKTTAELSIDKSRWKVNGNKQFITNAGFAGLFSTFVKIDGKNSCLLIEGGALGLTVGKEEEKMGLHGSSTCPLTFENCLTDATNVLGDVGKGHKIVMNTLNIGRLKLAAAKVGLIKLMLSEGVKHAGERSQFGKPLIAYEAVRAKLADMAVNAWVGEAMTYRTAKLVEDRIHAGLPIEQLSQECALIKVALSEWGSTAVDECLQIHGGVGYTEELLVCRAYRDARISRIYEGTSEINRFAVIDGLGKQVLGGKLNIFGPPPSDASADAFDAEMTAKHGGDPLSQCVPRAKATVRFLLQHAMQTHMKGLAQHQQLLTELADAVIALYALESAELRCEKHAAATGTTPPALASAALLCCRAQLRRIEAACQNVLTELPEPKKHLDYAARLLKMPPAYTWRSMEDRRTLADAIVEKGGYPF